MVGGSTGEGAGLTELELYEAVRVVIQSIDGALPVLGGVIADTSEEAIRLGLAAKRAGACGLQVPPPHFQYVTSVEILDTVLSRYNRCHRVAADHLQRGSLGSSCHCFP